MSWLLDGTLEHLAPWLDSAPLPRAVVERVRALARAFPARLTNCIYLELWLDAEPARLDVILRIDEGTRVQLLASDQGTVSDELRERPAWQRAVALAREWARADGALSALVTGFWLEFDLALDTAGTVEPRVFVDLAEPEGALPAAELAMRATDALRPLLTAPLPADTAHRLRACFEALPSGATLPYVGVGGTTGRPLVRICLRGIGGHLPRYLAEVGWPGDVDELSRKVLEPLGAAAVLHLDLGPEVRPRLGLEYPFTRAGQGHGRLAEDRLLVDLVARGWCAPHTLDAVRAWPGRSIEVLRHQIWQSRVARRLNHVKIAYAAGEPVAAKAYLCAHHEPSPGGTVVGMRPRLFGFHAHAPARDGTYALSGSTTGPSARQPDGRPSVESPRPAPFRRLLASGTRFAVAWPPTGGSPMTMSHKEQQALEAVLQRASVDAYFRQRLLDDPRCAISEAFGVTIPSKFRVKFIEREKDVDALVVLPDFQRPNGELDDQDLDNCAGGTGGDPDNGNWAAGIPPGE
ncbi:MAG: hypothetical protein ABW221_11915 [Vicinamibacteria bacterium]